MYRIVEGGPPPFPENASPELKSFLSQCFEKDPTMRPSADILFEHDWVKPHLALNKVRFASSLLRSSLLLFSRSLRSRVLTHKVTFAASLILSAPSPRLHPLPSTSQRRHRKPQGQGSPLSSLATSSRTTLRANLLRSNSSRIARPISHRLRSSQSHQDPQSS